MIRHALRGLRLVTAPTWRTAQSDGKWIGGPSARLWAASGRMPFSSQQRTPPTPSSTKDYYKVLQISKDASTVDVRKAFFNLAKKYHPDLNTHKREEDRQ